MGNNKEIKYKSYLMGAAGITDKDLIDLKIEIATDDDPDVRKLIIPKSFIENYKGLIRQKLSNGFWNDFVGEDKIYFIFKMADGEIIEYSYKEENRQKIAELCTKLNKDPIDKTSNLLKYLADNSFYTDEINKYQNANQF